MVKFIIIKNISSYKDLSQFRRKTLVCLSVFNLVPILTVEENICLPLLINKKKVSQERLDEVIENLGLSRKRHSLANQLSGGEKQRTAIGRAIISKPQILLADEPTGNLDSKNAEQIIGLLVEMNKEKQTILMVTHDKDIATHCKRSLVLSDGKIIEDTGQ